VACSRFSGHIRLSKRVYFTLQWSGIKLVRPLSTVDNTRDYACVSHSRQWSNYNLLDMVCRQRCRSLDSHLNVSYKRLFFPVAKLTRLKLKGKGPETCYSALTRVGLKPRSALKSQKWQLIGISWWWATYRSTLRRHPLPAL